MMRLVIGVLVCGFMAPPALAQKKQSAVDPCAPIGKTSDGRLVYSLKCDAIPVAVAPPSPPVASVVAPEEEDKGGLFRNPFPSLIRPTTTQRSPGVGPAGAGP